MIQIQKQQKMKSVTQKKYSPQRIYQSKNQSLQFAGVKQNKSPLKEEELRRYSEFPTECLQNKKKQSIESRLTYNKSQHPVTRIRSVTPGSRAQTAYVNEYESKYRKLQLVLKKQNENFFYQNQFLKQQIGKLYKRQAKQKCLLKRYKQQLRVLRMQNAVYQQRYQYIKSCINTVIEKITEVTVSNQVIEDKDMLRNSSIEMVNKLRQELNLYEQIQSQQKLKTNSQEKETNNQQQSLQFHSGLEDPDNQHNLTNNFLILSDQKLLDSNDLQQTRHLKQHQYNHSTKLNQQSLKKPPKPTPPNAKKVLIQNSDKQAFSPLSFEQSTPSNSNHNSDTKNIDMCSMKTDNFLLQDTSQSNHLNFVNHQIQELTDQSEALMYELKKKGNHDQQIKKKIIRISQKIRELKMQTQTEQFQRFTSLQEIVPKY